MGRRKKKRPAECIEEMTDGRYRIHLKVTVRNELQQLQETLPVGATLAEAVARRDELRELLRRGAPTRPAPPPTLANYSKSWLTIRSKRVRAATATTYAKVLGRYVLPHLGHLPLDDIRRSDLEAWLGWLERDSGLSPRSQRSAWRYGLMVLRDACVDHHLSDPSLRLQGPRSKVKQAGRALSRQELHQLVAAGEAMCLARYSGLVVLAYTGMRRSELRLQLRRDVDLGKDPWLSVSHSKTIHGEGRKVPLPDVAADLVRRWLEEAPDSPYVWPAPSRPNKPRSVHWPPELVAQAAKLAKLGHVTPHDLRRTYISLMERAQVNRLALQQIVGHSDSRTTDGYVHVSDMDRRQVLQVIQGGQEEGRGDTEVTCRGDFKKKGRGR